MFQIIKRFLVDQGGWMAAIPLAISAASSIAGGARSKKGQKKAAKASGYEKWDVDRMNRLEGERYNQEAKYLEPGREAAVQGGLFGAISDAFNPNPTTTELQGVTGQERQLRNQIANTGARGGLLRKQMLDASKSASANRLALMENARQQAAQRGYGILNNIYPTAAQDIAQIGQADARTAAGLAQENLRSGRVAAGAAQDAAGSGSGLGSVLASLMPSGGNKTGKKGAISDKVGGTPTFAMPQAGEGFAQIPFTGAAY